MNRDIFATVSFNAQEYNANKKAAAKADSAAPAAEAVPSKKRKKSEDGGEKKKVAFRRDDDDWSLQIYVYKSFPHKEVYLCDFIGVRSTQKKKKSKKKDA